MNIKINSCLAGAKISDGITVVIDVYRASNTIISILSSGAKSILPIGELEKAYKSKKGNPNNLLFGEREGVPPPGFDYDNSPSKAEKLNLKRKKIILATSAGSIAIVNATKADEILIGSFANAEAITSYIKKRNPKKVSLLAAGFPDSTTAKEDEECAIYIKARLENINLDFEKIRNKILQPENTNRLLDLGLHDDVKICSKLNTHDIVPRLDKKLEQ
jgi:2-phosphosulfolactate phosphatase